MILVLVQGKKTLSKEPFKGHPVPVWCHMCVTFDSPTVYYLAHWHAMLGLFYSSSAVTVHL